MKGGGGGGNKGANPAPDQNASFNRGRKVHRIGSPTLLFREKERKIAPPPEPIPGDPIERGAPRSTIPSFREGEEKKRNSLPSEEKAASSSPSPPSSFPDIKKMGDRAAISSPSR